MLSDIDRKRETCTYRAIIRINPRSGNSGVKNCCFPPEALATPSAAILPLLAALSIVEGQSVFVQSPARYRPSPHASGCGLNRSNPGVTENVARASFNTPARNIRASRIAGKKRLNSSIAGNKISSRVFFNSTCDALITSS